MIALEEWSAAREKEHTAQAYTIEHNAIKQCARKRIISYPHACTPSMHSTSGVLQRDVVSRCVGYLEDDIDVVVDEELIPPSDDVVADEVNRGEEADERQLNVGNNGNHVVDDDDDDDEDADEGEADSEATASLEDAERPNVDDDEEEELELMGSQRFPME
jgi:hypothetical protein